MYERWISEESGALPLVLLHRSSLGLTSLKQARKILERGCCSVNGTLARIASKVISEGDSIEVYPVDDDWTEEACTVLYEDDHLAVINKPAGVTVDEASIRKALSAPFPFFLVHRLDKWTSGVLLLSKSEKFRGRLEELFRQRKVKKEYLAIVDGPMERKDGEITQPIVSKNDVNGVAFCGVSEQGSEAITRYRVLFSTKKASLLLVRPKTGRTHQIRVHLSSIGHPLLGDYQYAHSFQSMYRPYRQLLHAWKLWFQHPFTNKNVFVKAPVPQDIQKIGELAFGDAFKELLCEHS